jgi:hypothetical protein
VTSQFLYFELEPSAFEKGGYFRSQPNRPILLTRRTPKNVTNLLFHTATVLFGTALQPGFHALLDIPDQKLGHVGISNQSDIMISF